MKATLLAASLLCLGACSTVGTVVSTVGKAVYTSASTAVNAYCSKPESERAVIQLVVSGHIYNSELCPIVSGDTTLQAELDKVAQDKAADLINARIEGAVASGAITEEQAAAIVTPQAGVISE